MGSNEVPPGFVDLYKASISLDSNVSVIGVVSDFLPASQSRGTDWMCTFSIADHSYGGLGEMGNLGLKVRFFQKKQSDLPTINGVGDVVLLRHMKVKQWNGMTLLMSCHSSTWIAFPSIGIPEQLSSNPPKLDYVKEVRAPQPGAKEMIYATTVCNTFDRSSFRSLPPQDGKASSSQVAMTSSASTSAKREKFSLVQDMKINTYYDLVAQVVKIYPSNNKVDLYVSDFTGNPCLFFYEWGQDDDLAESCEGNDLDHTLQQNENDRKWPGPFGRLTLAITLWPPHSYAAQAEVKRGDLVSLRNVHIRLDNDSKMVGSLHSDKRHQDRIDISLVKDPSQSKVAELLRRREDYETKFNAQSRDFVNEVRAVQSKQSGKEKSLSKKQMRKRKRQEREKGLAQLDKGMTSTEPPEKRQRNSDTENDRTPTSTYAKSSSSRLNPNVRCSNHCIPTTSLSSIISFDHHTNKTPRGTTYTLPFQNMKTRSTVRIIDYFPPDLADFAVPLQSRRRPTKVSRDTGIESHSSAEDFHSAPISPSSGNRAYESGSENGSEGGTPRPKWEWRFALTLSDGSATKSPATDPATMTAYVCGPDAECLLKLDAKDLRSSPKDLAVLREKLFLLWGDLDERKTKERERKKMQDNSGQDQGLGQDKDPNIDRNQLEAKIVSDEARAGRTLVETNGNRRNPAADRRIEEKGRPFECCLKEYGVKVRNCEAVRTPGEGDEETEWKWERKWRMFGCTII